MQEETGTNNDILKFCHTAYDISFLIFARVNVNGEYAHPLYKYLKRYSPEKFKGDIDWKFTKF
ncbi:hypothetical protein [Borrelia coriaceae]|uniref:Glutathione peroxidase-like protein bsaA n=1 Tax=Borrelia coriaceae ATCC 43381 TaxID=1408429 RepID=W5T071_9SPIR|nr:Glutathione peroxidase -like protein bsaA [Borrelia coriaceae ATCC 43381]